MGSVKSRLRCCRTSVIETSKKHGRHSLKCVGNSSRPGEKSSGNDTFDEADNVCIRALIGNMKHAKYVRVNIQALDSPNEMHKEMQRQKVFVNETAYDGHGSPQIGGPASPRKAKHDAFITFCELLTKKVRSNLSEVHLSSFGTKPEDTKETMETKSPEDMSTRAVIGWIFQNVGGNRIGRQTHDALETFLGIDYARDRSLLLFDMGNSAFVRKLPEKQRAARVGLESSGVTIRKIHFMQLCFDKPGHKSDEVMLRVESTSSLDLETGTEGFHVDVAMLQEPEVKRTFTLSAKPKPFCKATYGKNFVEALGVAKEIQADLSERDLARKRLFSTPDKTTTRGSIDGGQDAKTPA